MLHLMCIWSNMHCKDRQRLDRYFHIKNKLVSLSGQISFILAHATVRPFSSWSLREKQSIHWLHRGHIDTCRLVIMADTQQKINVVVVDLIMVISQWSCLMWHQSTKLISQLILSFSTVQFVAKMQGGSIHKPFKLSEVDCRFYFRIWMTLMPYIMQQTRHF